MPPIDEEPKRTVGSQQTFNQCPHCRGRFVVVASFEPGTDARDVDVMCPHCAKANAIAMNGRVSGKVKVTKDRSR